MTKRSHAPILLVCAAICAACGSETGFAPERPEPEGPVFTTFLVSPPVADLPIMGPGNWLQLSVEARDETGTPMPGEGAATYSSSAPAIARVNSGVVTAVAPGTAVITAMLTLGGVTRTASMTATVHAYEGPSVFPEIAGVYDLTALITSFDDGWGVDLAGYRYTAVLTLSQEGRPPWFGGTYADLNLIGPAGDSIAVAAAGVVTAYLDFRGRVIIELLGAPNRIGLDLVVANLATGSIDGIFGCCGHISGTFTATRRQAK